MHGKTVAVAVPVVPAAGVDVPIMVVGQTIGVAVPGVVPAAGVVVPEAAAPPMPPVAGTAPAAGPRMTTARAMQACWFAVLLLPLLLDAFSLAFRLNTPPWKHSAKTVTLAPVASWVPAFC